MACSISDPEKPALFSASDSILKLSRFCLRLSRRILNINSRVLLSGKSTKNISSRRPLRINYGGSVSILFAVATINTFSLFSDIQVNIVPNILLDVPDRFHQH